MKVIESRPTQEPGVCFICENSPDVPYVDTLKNFDPPGPSNIRGRKYVCLWCVEEAAKVFGFLPHTTRVKLEAEVERLKDVIKDLEPVADLTAAIKEAADIIAGGHTAKAERDAVAREAGKVPNEVEVAAQLHAEASARNRTAAKAKK